MITVRRWLNHCDTTHDQCRSKAVCSLPSRLIDVTEISREDKKGVRLVQPAVGQTGTYSCLSHCWGKTEIQCCTTKDTLAQALKIIDYKLIAQNFRDAITITRNLGLRYIWID